MFDVIIAFIIVHLYHFKQKLALKTQHLVPGKLAISHSSSTPKLSQYGTSVVVFRILMRILSVYRSIILNTFVVGASLTKGLPLIGLRSFIVLVLRTDLLSYLASLPTGSDHGVALTSRSPL